MSRRTTQPQPRPEPLLFSEFSSPPIPDSGWACTDFLLGAGMVIIQPSSHKVVILSEERHGRREWFLPRGRKDVGECLEQTALREAFEESGYQVEPFPIYMQHRQPLAPSDRNRPLQTVTEAIYITTMRWGPRWSYNRAVRDPGGEYIISWFLGSIPENAVRHQGVCMPDEQGYMSHIVTFEDAWRKLTDPAEREVFKYACHVYCTHLKFLEEIEKETQAEPAEAPS